MNHSTPNQTTTYGIGTSLDVPFAEAVEEVTAALKAEGFGVLTTIDVRQTMRDKLDIEFEPYVILGACNPQLAHRGLQAEHELGLLLPCNVIVHEHEGKTAVSVVDPVQMLDVVGDNPELSAVAAVADAGLRRVMTRLQSAHQTA
jgi:uncharacterized protein (DUF302 family)